MRAIGVDLAWGPNGRTGLCALEGDRVLGSATVRTDAEIDAWIAQWVTRLTDDVVVGIDAPLVVPNRRGGRPCDAVFCAALAAREAGVYPANLGLPAFRGGVRGAALARRLRLTLDPAACAASPRRAAIEVYPHSAMVSLFGLARTLKYKRKHAPVVRAAAFVELLDGLRGLTAADPPLDVKSSPRWAALEATVAGGGGGRVEDELDAYVCAYAAVYHCRWRGRRSLVVGDVRRGYIVTPVDGAAEQALRAAAGRRGVRIG